MTSLLTKPIHYPYSNYSFKNKIFKRTLEDVYQALKTTTTKSQFQTNPQYDQTPHTNGGDDIKALQSLLVNSEMYKLPEIHLEGLKPSKLGILSKQYTKHRAHAIWSVRDMETPYTQCGQSNSKINCHNVARLLQSMGATSMDPVRDTVLKYLYSTSKTH